MIAHSKWSDGEGTLIEVVDFRADGRVICEPIEAPEGGPWDEITMTAEELRAGYEEVPGPVIRRHPIR